MPAIELTPSSTFFVTSLSTISGEAPGYSVIHHHHREVDVRELVHLQALVGEHAQHDQREHQHGREDRVSSG